MMYAMSPASYQNAYGGKFAGGELGQHGAAAHGPGLRGVRHLRPEGPPARVRPGKAKEALKKCGQPDGFETTIGYRSSRDKEKAIAEAFQQALGKVGIKVNVKPMPDDTYTSEQCGKPSYIVANNVGICVYGWGADWTTGYGFLSQLVDSRVINPEGGSPNFSVRIPEVDKLIDQLAVGAGRGQACRHLRARSTSWSWRTPYIYPGVYAKGVLLRGEERDEHLHQRRLQRSVRLHRHGREAVTHVRFPTTPKVGEGESGRSPGIAGAGHPAADLVSYIIRRLIAAVGLVIVISIITFAIFYLIPRMAGATPESMAARYVGRSPDPAQLQAAAESLGFYDPIHVQYWDWLKGVVVGKDVDHRRRRSTTVRHRAWATPSAPASRCCPRSCRGSRSPCRSRSAPRSSGW